MAVLVLVLDTNYLAPIVLNVPSDIGKFPMEKQGCETDVHMTKYPNNADIKFVIDTICSINSLISMFSDEFEVTILQVGLVICEYFAIAIDLVVV